MNIVYILIILLINVGLIAIPSKKSKKITMHDQRARNRPPINQQLRRYMQQHLHQMYAPLKIQDINYGIDAYLNPTLNKEGLLNLVKNNFEVCCVRYGLDYTTIPMFLRDLRGWEKTTITRVYDYKEMRVLCLNFLIIYKHSDDYTIKSSYFDTNPEINEWIDNELVFIKRKEDGILKSACCVPRVWLENN